MRRGRLIAIVAVTITAFGVGFGVTGVASAATPAEICQSIKDGTFRGADPGDVDAYNQALQNDPTISGYCSPIPLFTPPPQQPPAPAECTEVTADTPGAQLAPNGKYYTNVPSGGPAVCGPAQQQQSVAPQQQSVAPAPPKSAVVVPTQGVKAATKAKKAAPTPVRSVAPAQHQTAPITTTRQAGTLPFTGAELTIFTIVGLALIAGGLLLRITGRQKRTQG